jgi:hypothetical protein
MSGVPGWHHTPEARTRISEGQKRRNATRPPPGPGLAQLRAESKPGECICCGDPALAKSTNPAALRRRVRKSGWQDTCGDEVCRAAWFRYWRRDQRATLKAIAAAAKALEAA